MLCSGSPVDKTIGVDC